MQLNNVFNTINSSAQYRIKMQVLGVFNFDALPATTITQINILAVKSDNTTTTSLQTISSVVEYTWYGIDITTTIGKDYRSLRIVPTKSGGTDDVYIKVKNLQVFLLKKAEVQDSEMNWAGRRTSYYEGTKITSTDINVDSADTIDGGPVITVNTVNSDQPSYNPLGVSTVITGTTNTNQSQ